jgi:hypothetical protein
MVVLPELAKWIADRTHTRLATVTAAADGTDGAPPRDMTPSAHEQLGIPVTPVADDVVPESLVESDGSGV